MKKLKVKIVKGFIVTFALLAVIPQNAQAHYWWHQFCDPVHESTLLASHTKYTSSCELAIPLQITRVDHYYPLMNTALTVDAWQGSYARKTETEMTYRIDTYDCYGYLQNSETLVTNVQGVAQFPIDNPNLHDDVNTSFAANAPMTDEEAEAALNAAEQTCFSATSTN